MQICTKKCACTAATVASAKHKLRAAYIEATKSQSPEGKTPEARAGEPAAPEGAVFNLNTGAIAIAEAEAALQRARAEL